MADEGAFNWVSAYVPDDATGGWKAMQFHLLRALERRLGRALRIAPVDVPEEFAGKWISRIQKLLHIPRPYAYYSESRLDAYARAVQARLAINGKQMVVFFGALPFVKCQPEACYYIYTDGAFFMHYWEYNRDHSHAQSEVERICAAEADFMRRAAGVWCSSQWAADRIAKEYHIPSERVRFVGTGPADVPPPVEPVRYENFLVMIAADFDRKGGRLAVESVAAARKHGVDISIKFIGGKPPSDVLALPFVSWCGWLDMEKDVDRAKFAEVLSRAGAQILLSRSDLTPLAILEAAVYSKATIAMAVGGIPEMIRDGVTGWVLNPRSSSGEIGARLARLMNDVGLFEAAGQAAKRYMEADWSWNAVSAKVKASLRQVPIRVNQE
jgi:glycosyltransferase involved in cell wall biosynthesis